MAANPQQDGVEFTVLVKTAFAGREVTCGLTLAKAGMSTLSIQESANYQRRRLSASEP